MGRFVHRLQVTPRIRFVAAADHTLASIVKYCTMPEKATPLCVDTTFGIGDFFVTTSSFKDMSVVNRTNGEHPTIPGPALFHIDQDDKVFSYFAQTLVEVNDDVKNLLFLGSDRDKAMINGMSKHFLFARNVFCTKHVKDDIKRKFADDLSYIPSSVRNEILKDIFGSENTKERGLMDCESEVEFDGKVYHLYQKWDCLEEQYLKGEDVRFSRYFRTYIEKDMKQGMILPVRRAAGLSDDFFFNNQTESVNFRLKNKIKQWKERRQTSGRPAKKCSLSEAIDIYKSLIDETHRNLIRAMVDRGPYKLAKGYEKMYVPIHLWIPLPKEKKEKAIKRFLGSSLTEDITGSVLEDSNPSSYPTGNANEDTLAVGQPVDQPLTTFLPEFILSGLPANHEVDWNGAINILKDNALGKMPWSDASYIVRSDSDANQSYTVRSVGKDSLHCNCKRYELNRICKHSIAVAKDRDMLLAFLRSWNANLTSMLKDTVPKRVGKKKSDKDPRKRSQFVQHRDLASYTGSRAEDIGFPTNKFELVFLKDTKAYSCYGCGKQFRAKEDVAPKIVPPSPYDIVFRHKGFRSFRRPGSIGLTISKSSEYMYYHTQRICFANKKVEITAADIFIHEDTRSKLNAGHCNLLNSRFKLALR